MSEAIKLKRDELRASIEATIVGAINDRMASNFADFIKDLQVNTREDQVTKVFGADVLELIKEYQRIK